MQKSARFLVSMFAGLLSIAPATTLASQESTCMSYCATDLKACRAKADANTRIWKDLTENYHSAHAELISNPELRATHNNASQKRNMERYQECEQQNTNCRNQCAPDSVQKKNSVIFKQ